MPMKVATHKNIYKRRTVFLFSLIGVIFLLNTLSVYGVEKRFVNTIGMEFVLIPQGTFVMGSPPDELNRNREEQQHEATISEPFYLQTTEVTLEQWWALMGKKLFGRRKGSPDMPVTRVCWHDSRKFIKKLNSLNQGVYRLPTEAEWEYACRAGTKTAYSWGDIIDCGKAVHANNPLKESTCTLYFETLKLAPGGPAAVKRFAPNAWGLYDMHGNVWEWCSDDFQANIHLMPRVDPVVETGSMQKVRRGGSWFSRAHSLRSANRAFGHAATRFRTTGFRIVRVIDEKAK